MQSLIEWWEAGSTVDIEQLVLPFECSRLIELNDGKLVVVLDIEPAGPAT